MAAIKISKDELGIILKKIISINDIDDVHEYVEKIADEYHIDIVEVEEEQDIDEIFIDENSSIFLDDEDDDY